MAFIQLAVKTVAAFLICWLPISILTIAKSSAIKIHPKVESTIFTFAFANSLINPFVYFAHMRKAIAAALGCMKAANMKRVSVRDNTTLGISKEGKKITKSGSVVSKSVQPKNAVSSSHCFKEECLIGNHVTVIDHNKEVTNAHLEMPKARVNNFVE